MNIKGVSFIIVVNNKLCTFNKNTTPLITHPTCHPDRPSLSVKLCLILQLCHFQFTAASTQLKEGTETSVPHVYVTHNPCNLGRTQKTPTSSASLLHNIR